MNDTNREEGNKPLDFTLKSVDASHEYLQKRGIHQDVAELFGVGYFFGKGSMSNRVVIPIHNRAGELVAYAGRVVDDSEPKYNLPTGFHKSLELFNLHRATRTDTSRGMIIVEGYFDVMKVHQAGFPNVVALMGSALSDHQEQLLIEHFDRVVVMLDGDEGGRAAAQEITPRLTKKIFFRIVDVPDGTQPDRLASQEIQALLASLK